MLPVLAVLLMLMLIAPLGSVDVHAAGQAGQTPSAEAGRQLASQGAPNGVAACASCHGSNGEGNAAAGFPALAGQPAPYLLRQMRSFSNGARSNPVMTPIAKAMNADQQHDVSAWYASLAPHGGAAAGTKGALAERGRNLASVGDETLQLQACANCHGPGGAGEAPDYPSLRGQPASYFTAAMNEWKSGVRKTDPSGQMPAIAQRLSAEQVTALAAWFASLPPAAPAQRSNIAAGTRARPAVAARSDGPGPPPASTAAAAANPSGTGSEQGAPLTGGNQGPGGGGGAAAGNPGQAGGASSPGASGDGRAAGTARPPSAPPVPARPPDLPRRPPD